MGSNETSVKTLFHQILTPKSEKEVFAFIPHMKAKSLVEFNLLDNKEYDDELSILQLKYRRREIGHLQEF